MSLLELENVHSYYGHIHALHGISLQVEEGRDRHPDRRKRRGQKHHPAHHLRPDPAAPGHDHVSTARISPHMPPHQIVEQGVGHVPEGRGIFPRLTVRENLEMGAFTLNDPAEVDRRMEYGL